MPRAEDISERLPHFYKHWERESSIFGLIAALGKRLDESEKDLVSIMRVHWVDTANIGDLDKLGALYNIKRNDSEVDSDFRNRLKTAIISYKGGGTLGAIRTMVRIALKLPEEDIVQIVENPPLVFKRTWKKSEWIIEPGKTKVSTDDKWIVYPGNIHDTIPEITIAVETENAKIADPTITNLTTGETITFRGNISHNNLLKISNGKAMLNNEDCTDKLSTTSIPKLPRKKSKWQYTEYVGANLGKFDQTQFDQSVFMIEIISSVTFGWTADQPAAFDLMLPKEMLIKAGVTVKNMQDLVDSAKACGIKAEVKEI